MLLSSCGTKPTPVRQDERACIVHIFTEADAAGNSYVKAGDVVMTGWCAERFVKDLELEILRATK